MRYNLHNFLEVPENMGASWPQPGHRLAIRFMWALYELYVMKLRMEDTVVAHSLSSHDLAKLKVIPTSKQVMDSTFSNSRRGRIEFELDTLGADFQNLQEWRHSWDCRNDDVVLTVLFYRKGKKPIATARYVFPDVQDSRCVSAHFEADFVEKS